MSCWTKPELENMLEDVVNALDLSESVIENHGPLGTPPAELVRLVLEQKDLQIRMLKAGMVEISPSLLALTEKVGDVPNKKSSDIEQIFAEVDMCVSYLSKGNPDDSGNMWKMLIERINLLKTKHNIL